MTNKTRQTEINIETHQRTVIRYGKERPSLFCERCRCAIHAYTPDTVAAHFGMTVYEVCRAIEADRFHLAAASRGLPLVCGNSLVGITDIVI